MSHDVKVDRRVREQATRHAQGLNGFDYNAPAELFPSRSRTGRSRSRYMRFDTAAEGLRFVIEELPAPRGARSLPRHRRGAFRAGRNAISLRERRLSADALHGGTLLIAVEATRFLRQLPESGIKSAHESFERVAIESQLIGR